MGAGFPSQLFENRGFYPTIEKTSGNQRLYSHCHQRGSLRTLRLEIARVEKVPPYIVFSDKTLVHMCRVRPKTKEEMLSVSGVGEFKFAKYGERFLKAIG